MRRARGTTLTLPPMSMRVRHLPVLLAIGALAACSAESVTGASAVAELPQPRPTFSAAATQADAGAEGDEGAESRER